MTLSILQPLINLSAFNFHQLSWLWKEATQSASMPNWILIAGLQIINIPVYWILFTFFFPNSGDFKEAVLFWLTPDIWSLLQGKAMDDFFAEVKLFFFLALLVGFSAIEYNLVVKHIIPMF